jgi:hypothetical protein
MDTAGKVKTPLTLSGAVIVVLYAIYKQVLSLSVFANVGADSTFIILQSILNKLFWLALIAIVLGVASYLTTFILGRKAPTSSSNVSLIDASLDPHDSPYEQVIEAGRKTVKPKTESAKMEATRNDKHR